jgi:hypothetical protein
MVEIGIIGRLYLIGQVVFKKKLTPLKSLAGFIDVSFNVGKLVPFVHSCIFSTCSNPGLVRLSCTCAGGNTRWKMIRHWFRFRPQSTQSSKHCFLAYIPS